MKTTLVSIIAILISVITYAQKPSKTHNFEKFGKKAVMSMAYIHKMCVNDAALEYISKKTGTSTDELKNKKEADLVKINEDIKFISESGIYGAMGDIELTNVKESPIKTADIVVNYKNKAGNYQLILTNCVQTNISWYMGDGIKPAGDGVAKIIAKRKEKKEKAESGVLGKLSELDKKQTELLEESDKLKEAEQTKRNELNALRKGHVSTPFSMNGLDKSSKYYKHEQTNMPLQGYYVTKGGELVSAVIAYQKPEFLIGDFASASSLFICKEANGKKVDVLNPDSEPNFKEYINKGQIQAFFVGGQLYANINKVGWRIVTSEGSIHTFINMVKFTSNNKTSYQTFEQTQKMDGTAFGSILKGPSTNVLLDLMEDCPEIAQKLKDGTYSQFEAIVRYNYWYDLNYPDKVKYIPAPLG